MKVLVADDHATTRRLIADILEIDGHEVYSVSDGAQALAALSRDEFHIALVDWMMPHVNGVQLCQTIRQQSADSYLYIILVTGRGQTEDLVTGMEAGADDYLVKPFSSGELRARLRAAERMARLQQQLRDEGKRSAALALTDELTGLPNRRAVLQRLDEEMERTGREGRPLSVILVDLDRFKRVNDGFGHGAGDEVLVEFARRLRSKVRSYDVVARIGGDEFLVLLPGVPQHDAVSIAERLRDAVASAHFGADGGRAHGVTASFGVALLVAGASESGLLADADAALYLAKNNGGNQVSVPTSAGDPQTSETASVGGRT